MGAVAIRYIVEEVSANGAQDALVSDFPGPVVVVGRGAECDIRLPSTLVSLNHAKISVTVGHSGAGGQCTIDDLGSMGGVLVNRQLVKHAVLRLGDVIKLGDVVLDVAQDGEVWVFRTKRAAAVEQDSAEFVAASLRRLSVRDRLPSLRLLSLLVILGVLAWVWLWPMFTKSQKVWSSGPISRNHAFIEHDCAACHEGGFSRVKDSYCKSCHTLSNHGSIINAKHNHPEPRCASCHREHNGEDGVVLRHDGLCTTCHANLANHPTGVAAKTTRPDVASWDKHPEFSVSIPAEVVGVPLSRVRMDDTARLVDRSHVKLNHKIHLKPNLKGRSGPVTLGCADCHRLKENFREIKPLTMEGECRSCHGLEFDDRLPGTEVPHGDPDVVYRYLYSEYAKLFLGAKDDVVVQETFSIPGRTKPGGRAPSIQAEPQSDEDFVRAFVEKESRKAERLLFTKTACVLCHEVSEKDASPEELRERGDSRFEVLTPQMPEKWMSESVFDHGAHDEMKCEGCHDGVRQSTKTADVLLPKIADCRACHASQHIDGKVASDCVMCHSYHDPRPFSAAAKRTVKEILGIRRKTD